MARIKNIKFVLLKSSLFLSSFSVLPIDNAHFYRAAFFWGEPRLEKPGLFSLDVSAGYGATKTSRNENNKKVSLLNAFGPQEMQALGKNIILNPNNNLDKILIDLQELPQRDNFGQLQFNGKFTIVETVISLFQNLKNGFFLQAYLPIRRLDINNITFKDLSPRDLPQPNRSNQVWKDFLNSFNAIMQRFDLSLKPAKSTGAGDLSFLVGWALNYQDTTHVDYIDVCSKIGILFPTGRTRDENRPFDLPLGYNGHYGLPIFVQGSFGALEWFTMGGNIGALFLFNKTKNIRVKTAEEQNGLIKLAKEMVNIESGTVWTYGGYVKADHFAAGLSTLIGYSFNKKDADTLNLKNNNDQTNDFIINNDSTRRGWDMHVLNIIVDYDLANDPCKTGWRFSFFYNRIMAGKRVFNTQIKSFNIGLDAVLTW